MIQPPNTYGFPPRARQHRERQAAEEQHRRQEVAAQLAAQLAAKRAREERMRAPEQVGKMGLGPAYCNSGVKNFHSHLFILYERTV